MKWVYYPGLNGLGLVFNVLYVMQFEILGENMDSIIGVGSCALGDQSQSAAVFFIDQT